MPRVCSLSTHVCKPASLDLSPAVPDLQWKRLSGSECERKRKICIAVCILRYLHMFTHPLDLLCIIAIALDIDR